MKSKDLLKYFLDGTKAKVFVIESEEDCGKSSYRQIFDEFNCSSEDIFDFHVVQPGDYLVTYTPKGLKPTFIIVLDEVVRYFTLIE